MSINNIMIIRSQVVLIILSVIFILISCIYISSFIYYCYSLIYYNEVSCVITHVNVDYSSLSINISLHSSPLPSQTPIHASFLSPSLLSHSTIIKSSIVNSSICFYSNYSFFVSTIFSRLSCNSNSSQCISSIISVIS